MKAFISYRFTGETKEDLTNLLIPVRDALKEKDIDAYCNFFDEDLPVRSKGFKPHDYVLDAFKTIDGSDILFVILNSEEKSEGMLMEIGYAIARGLKLVVAVKEGIVKTYMPGMAGILIPYADVESLVKGIQETEF